MEIKKIEYLSPTVDVIELTDILTASVTPDDVTEGENDLPPTDW